jgi:hypothetical protein
MLRIALATSALTALVACQTLGSDQEEQSGTLAAQLSSTTASGVTYRLRQGTLDVGGIQISSESYLDSGTATVNLDPGLYELNLLDGWYLERLVSGQWETVDAELVSPNPRPFVIASGITTVLTLSFQVLGEIVTTGDGSAEVGIAVDDTAHETGAACADRIDNDGDGYGDCSDNDCYSAPNCAPMLPAPGTLVLTEIMTNPFAVTDSVGEWFEIYNPGNASVDLSGCEVSTANETEVVTIPVAYLIYPGEYRVFANSSDPAVNGGVPFAIATPMVLGNTNGDAIYMNCAGVSVISFDYRASYPACLVNGASCQLTSQMTTTGSTAVADSCTSTTVFGNGDLGTPGAANRLCP